MAKRTLIAVGMLLTLLLLEPGIHATIKPPTEDCSRILCPRPRCNVPLVLKPRKCCPECPNQALVCPPVLPGTIGICVEQCSSDEDCNRGEKCCFNGCGHVCKDPIPAKNFCIYNNQTYDTGERIRIRDRCSICFCTASGKVLCTQRLCPPLKCIYNSRRYKVGQSFPADDGCNTCTCSSSGRVACTLRFCLPLKCNYSGQVYNNGDHFPAGDGCNTCVCSRGRVSCTEKACNPSCPPKCSPSYCHYGRRNRRCSIPGPREIPGCTGPCQVTYCHACYFSEEDREPDPRCATCDTPISNMRCLKNWATCVRRSDWGKPKIPYKMKQDNFRCYRYPCTLRG